MLSTHRRPTINHTTAVGWVLLAQSVALVNASTVLTALYILLACVGWTLFLLFPVKMALFWLARETVSSMSPTF